MSGIITQNTLDSSGLIKSPEGGGAWNFIKKLTASASSDLSFVDGTDDVVLDSTYKTYFFTFNNMHVETANADFQFNMSIDTGSNYNVTKTSTRISVYHKEDDSGTAAFTYHGPSDLAQGTGFQHLFQNIGDDSDKCASGYLYLFEPSSTTFVKHFLARGNLTEESEYSEENYTAGYGNTTSAVDAIQFSMSSGNIDAGDICLYGVSS